MSELSSAALIGLNTAFTNILADFTPSPNLEVVTHTIKPAALGHYIGHHTDPAGDILGLRVDATVRVTVRANNANQLEAAVLEANSALLGIDRATMIQQGLLRIARDPDDEAGNDNNRRETLAFKVLYEYIQLPEAGEGIIEEIPITMAVSEAPPEG